MEKKYKAALYGRLSREDGDNLESESIKNQREYLRRYLEKQADISLVAEYFDDGYTGGNFNRPGWKKLMQAIEDKKIDTILTKDLSRMGRDYIKMGDYIERIFPEKRIRYIAINDDIDTAYETPGLDYLQFKLLFNDFYLKDGSKKIRKVIRSKKEQGQYTGWKGIYGYKRDPKDRHKLLVDEAVRDVVVRMFALAKQGYGPKGIADLFSKEKIPNPSTYANLNRGIKKETSTLWCDRTVGELLENPTYIGHLTQGKRKKVSYKSKKEVRIPKEDWIIVKNTHEAIIDEETFYTVQELLKKNKHNPYKKKDYLLRGFLYCKECGHHIGINTSQDKKRRYCACCYYTAHSKFHVCSPHAINYDQLEQMVLEELRNLANTWVDSAWFLEKVKEAMLKKDAHETIEKQICSVKAKIKQVTGYMDKAYLDKLDDKIDCAQYERLHLSWQEELERLTKKKQDLEKALAQYTQQKSKQECESLKDKIDSFLSFKNPKRELLVQLLDKIEISEDKTIEIHYKFGD